MDLMFSSPDQKDLDKIVINSDVICKKSEPLLIFSNKESNQKIIANNSWFLTNLSSFIFYD